MQTGSAPSPIEITVALASASFDAPEAMPVNSTPAFRSAARRQTFIKSRWLLGRLGQLAASSVAHCGLDAVVAGSSREIRLGIDVERIRDRDVLRLARFSFTEREVKDLEIRNGAERLRHFYSLWVLKEACAKAYERPLLEALATFEFDTHLRAVNGDLMTQLFEPEPGLLIGLALDAPTAVLHYERWPGGDRKPWPSAARA